MLVALMIISIVLFEFQYSTMVERQLAFNDLNHLQAYYLAKSGANIGLLRVALFARAKGSPQFASMIPKGFESYLERIWSISVPPFPPIKEEIKELDSKVDRDAAQKMLEETKVKEGFSTHIISSESSKINLNYLIIPEDKKGERPDFSKPNPSGLYEYVGTILLKLIETIFKESEDPYEEFGNVKPEEVVYNIMDWINSGDERLEGGDKDAYYEKQNPPYKAKRSPFYTVEELRLVRGINDELYEKLKPYITVYSDDGKVNINSCGKDMFKALYPDFSDDDIKKILEERTKLDGGWVTDAAFVDFVTSSLGRSGFKSTYSDPNDYPFTVASRSFLVESKGYIQKSLSQIEKSIRIGVALTGPKGGELDTGITTEDACGKAKKYWDKRQNACRSFPTNQVECASIFGGEWKKQPDEQFCCEILTSAKACPPKSRGESSKISGVRILYWLES